MSHENSDKVLLECPSVSEYEVSSRASQYISNARVLVLALAATGSDELLVCCTLHLLLAAHVHRVDHAFAGKHSKESLSHLNRKNQIFSASNCCSDRAVLCDWVAFEEKINNI